MQTLLITLMVGLKSASPCSTEPLPQLNSRESAVVMVDTREAEKRAQDLLAKECGASRDCSLILEQTEEHDFGWVFFWGRQEADGKFLTGRDVPGISPIVVHRDDGMAEFLPTFMPPQVQIEQLNDRWKRRH